MEASVRQPRFRRRPRALAAATEKERTIADWCASSQHPVAAAIRRWQAVLITFVASRLTICMLIGFSTMIVVPGESGPRGGFTGILIQGDGARYVDIAAAGYGSGPAGLSKVGLFPAYPMAVGAVAFVLRDAAISAMIVSNIALLIAGILLKELLDLHYKDARIGRLAVTFLMFSPASFFFSGANVEATLLMLTLGAWYAAATGRWLVASIAAAAAAASHNLGFLVLIPLASECVSAWQRQSISLRNAALLLASPGFGCGAVLLFSWSRFGDALAPLRQSELWRDGLVAPWEAIAATELIPPFYRAFTLLMLGSAAALWYGGIFLKVPRSYLLYSGVLLMLYACSPALPSIARWLCIVFPLFAVLAALVRRFEWSFEPLLACSITLLAFCTVMVANGHWMR